jgi:hypothetical protein
MLASQGYLSGGGTAQFYEAPRRYKTAPSLEIEKCAIPTVAPAFLIVTVRELNTAAGMRIRMIEDRCGNPSARAAERNTEFPLWEWRSREAHSKSICLCSLLKSG